MSQQSGKGKLRRGIAPLISPPLNTYTAGHLQGALQEDFGWDSFASGVSSKDLIHRLQSQICSRGNDDFVNKGNSQWECSKQGLAACHEYLRWERGGTFVATSN